MKTTFQFSKIATLGLTLVMACGLLTASVLDRTALDLAKEGNKYVIEQSRDKIVQIRSDKSSRSTTPTTWYVVYFESLTPVENATSRFATGTELKFTAGNLVSVKRNVQLLGLTTEQYAEMDASQLKVDSDKALDIALREPILENLKVMGTDMTLTQGTEGFPIWKISIWAAKKDTKIDLKVGEIWVSSVDGKVSKINVNPGRVG
ncbi:MAG TPA: hypothetical protein VGH19_12455 [Verrucomicrobiae bacterium]